MTDKKLSRERFIIKIIVLGSSNVGKTSLLTRFAKGKFSGERCPTVGADFLTKKIEIDDVDVILQMWDTAGQERFHQGTIGSPFYRGAHGALLVYDVNNDKSIEQLALWRTECLSHVEEEGLFPIVVVGNKLDLREQNQQNQNQHESDTTTETEPDRTDPGGVLRWCKDYMYGHIETSAKDGSGVEAAVGAVALLALEAQRSPAAVALTNKRLNSTASAASSQLRTVRLDSKYERKRDGYCEGCT